MAWPSSIERGTGGDFQSPGLDIPFPTDSQALHILGDTLTLIDSHFPLSHAGNGKAFLDGTAPVSVLASPWLAKPRPWRLTAGPALDQRICAPHAPTMSTAAMYLRIQGGEDDEEEVEDMKEWHV